MPGSPRHTSHRNTIHILVVASYLFYTIYEANYDLRSAPSFYTELGIPITAADREIKSRFRRLAALHHPDKIGVNGGNGNGADDSAAFFIHLKTASDTLQDAAKRFAYERFGPSMLTWAKCVTIKDFVTRAVLYTILPYYALAAATIYVLGLVGYMDFGKFYRWLILLTLCLVEVSLAIEPRFPLVLNGVNAVLTRIGGGLPPYLPFELIHLARKITITVYIALSQIGPILIAQMNPHADKAVEDEDKALKEGLIRLEGMARQMDADAARLIDMELMPFKGDEALKGKLRTNMREWLINNTIRSDPMVRDSLGTYLARRREDAPAGARGTR